MLKTLWQWKDAAAKKLESEEVSMFNCCIVLKTTGNLKKKNHKNESKYSLQHQLLEKENRRQRAHHQHK